MDQGNGILQSSVPTGDGMVREPIPALSARAANRRNLYLLRVSAGTGTDRTAYSALQDNMFVSRSGGTYVFILQVHAPPRIHEARLRRCYRKAQADGRVESLRLPSQGLAGALRERKCTGPHL